MTRDEVLRLAREAGLGFTPPRSGQYDGGRVGCDVVSLKRFAALVAAAEREACAQVCDELVSPSRLSDPARSWMTGTTDCAAAIRARGSHA